jgi:hypothetical protein
MPVDPPRLDAPTILAILDAHHVEYVVVGGYAAQLHGSSRVTTDIDLTPKRSTTNLERLAHALGDLEASIRVDDLEQGLPFDTSAEALAGMKTLNLRTPYGDIAALADIIRSKTAAGRPKDLRTPRTSRTRPTTATPTPRRARSQLMPERKSGRRNDAARIAALCG